MNAVMRLTHPEIDALFQYRRLYRTLGIGSFEGERNDLLAIVNGVPGELVGIERDEAVIAAMVVWMRDFDAMLVRELT